VAQLKLDSAAVSLRFTAHVARGRASGPWASCHGTETFFPIAPKAEFAAHAQLAVALVGFTVGQLPQVRHLHGSNTAIAASARKRAPPAVAALAHVACRLKARDGLPLADHAVFSPAPATASVILQLASGVLGRLGDSVGGQLPQVRRLHGSSNTAIAASARKRTPPAVAALAHVACRLKARDGLPLADHAVFSLAPAGSVSASRTKYGSGEDQLHCVGHDCLIVGRYAKM